MAQLDFMREKDNLSLMEIKQLKERLKSFEGPTTTGFKGFSTFEAQQQAMTATQNLNHTNNNFGGGQSVLKSPYSQYNGIPKASPGGFGQGTQLDFLQNNTQNPINVNEDNLRPLSGTDSDPIVMFLGTINKLHFLTNSLPPSLNKDHRLI